MKVCFYVNKSVIPNLELLKNIEFYQNDIKILKDIGFDVVTANYWRDIPRNCDILFAWWASSGAIPLLISKILRKPCFLVVGGSDTSLKDRSQAGYHSRVWWHKLIIKWALRNANEIFAISKDGLDDAVSLGAKRIHLVYLAIDSEKYKPVKIKRNSVVLTVTHLTKQNIERKGIKDIMRAMKTVLAKIPDAKLVIVGNKLNGYPELAELAKDLDIERNVYFAGKISEGKKIKYYNSSKVFVSPSEHEGFGVAIAEAMSCGLPVIVTNRGALPEVVGKAGLYVPFNNAQALAERIIYVMRNPSMAARLSAKSREQIKKFSYKNRKGAIEAIIKPYIKR